MRIRDPFRDRHSGIRLNRIGSGIVSSASIELMPRIDKDDVEKLSRGLPTRSRRGSRATGHRLTQKERILFEAAQRRGFLKLPVGGLRDNVVNLYRLWCDAEGRACIVLGGPVA